LWWGFSRRGLKNLLVAQSLSKTHLISVSWAGRITGMNHRDLCSSWSYVDTKVWFVGWIRFRFVKSPYNYLQIILKIFSLITGYNHCWCNKRAFGNCLGEYLEFTKGVMGRMLVLCSFSSAEMIGNVD
jgi:hypothetical protein